MEVWRVRVEEVEEVLIVMPERILVPSVGRYTKFLQIILTHRSFRIALSTYQEVIEKFRYTMLL